MERESACLVGKAGDYSQVLSKPFSSRHFRITSFLLSCRLSLIVVPQACGDDLDTQQRRGQKMTFARLVMEEVSAKFFNNSAWDMWDDIHFILPKTRRIVVSIIKVQ